MSIVSVENLSVTFGSFTAVDRVSFSVEEGEIFGLLGANGAGKTTTMRVLCGLTRPSSGKASVSSLDCERESEGIKKIIGHMPQKMTLYDDLTLLENLEFLAGIHRLSKQKVKRRLEELFEKIPFSDSSLLKRPLKMLPSGVKQQGALIGALLHDPHILFLDEPTAGVSPAMREKFWNIIFELTREKKTVFVTTHYMDEAEQCHRLVLMRGGQTVALDSPEHLKKKTFPHALYQIKLEGNRFPKELEFLQKQRYCRPFGRHYHVEISDPSLLSHLEKKYDIKKINPKLEDVFLALIDKGASHE